MVACNKTLQIEDCKAFKNLNNLFNESISELIEYYERNLYLCHILTIITQS